MDINRRTDYAIRLIAALASSNGEPLSVRLAADIQDVPYAFARSIQHELVVAGLIESQRGAKGGMVLARPAEELTLLQVIEAVQGPIGCTPCVREESWCPRDSQCPFHTIWLEVDALVRDSLGSKTIKDILESGSTCASNPLLCAEDAPLQKVDETICEPCSS